MIEGIDVSVFQGVVDWRAVAEANIQFAICRATVGLGHDDTFERNLKGARDAGLLVGAYHAFETAKDPVAQAKNFSGIIAGRIDLCPFLDFEGGCKGFAPGQGLMMAKSFCETVDEIVVKTCGVYTFPYFWKGIVSELPYGMSDAAAWVRDRPFWLALYPGKANPDTLAPFSSVDLHQYSGTSIDVPGVHTTCDRNRFYGTLTELSVLGAYIPASEQGFTD